MADDDVDTASIYTAVSSIRSMPSNATLTPMPTNIDEPPPYSAHDPNAIQLYASQGPPTSSPQSLPPSASAVNSTSDRRRLLLIFVHGFMGNETSFQSFPAHVHNIVSVLVSESHTVHTKIYPRYRSKKAIQVATNDFSSWLKPHESPDTDVVLIGHSMGGLLAAEVALLPSLSPAEPSPFRHRLLGTMSFDTPFLGMHPGVIKSGISSLFRFEPSPPHSPRNGPTSPSPSDPTPSMASGSSSTLSLGDDLDPNYNPAYPNDVRLPVRTGWQNAQHFVRKHAKHLRSATQQLIASHIEFGSCLADLDGLKVRYCRIRMLEDVDSERRMSAIQDQREPPRVRFVNYYTASTGRPKRPQPMTEAALESSAAMSTPIDEKRILSPYQNISYDISSEHVSVRSLEDEDPVVSDDESVLSELSDLDTLEDTNSEFSDATTLVSSIETSVPKIVLEDLASEEPSLAPPKDPGLQLVLPISPNSPAPQKELELQSALPVSPYPLAPPPPLLQQFDSPAAFKLAVKQHHDMVKHNFRIFKEEQKAEYSRLKARTINAPKARKEEIKAYFEAQKEAKKRIYESTRADWKAMYESMREDAMARKKEWMSQVDVRKAALNQLKHGRKLDAKLEKMDKRCQRQQLKMEKKVKRIESGHADGGDDDGESTPGYDVSTAPIAETIDAERAESIASSSPGQSRTNTMESTSSTNTSFPAHSAASAAASAAWKFSSNAAQSSPPNLPATSQQQQQPQPPPASSDYTSATDNISHRTGSESAEGLAGKNPRKTKDRKFCILPPKDGHGAYDPTWIRIFMKDVDEVGAHCGLFLPVGPGEEIGEGAQWGERYAHLIQDVAERIEGWVGDWMSARLLEEVQGGA